MPLNPYVSYKYPPIKPLGMFKKLKRCINTHSQTTLSMFVLLDKADGMPASKTLKDPM